MACEKAKEEGKKEVWKEVREWFESVKDGCSREEILKTAEKMMEKIKER